MRDTRYKYDLVGVTGLALVAAWVEESRATLFCNMDRRRPSLTRYLTLAFEIGQAGSRKKIAYRFPAPLPCDDCCPLFPWAAPAWAAGSSGATSAYSAFWMPCRY